MLVRKGEGVGSLWAETHHYHILPQVRHMERIVCQSSLLGTMHLLHLACISLRTSGYTPAALCTHLLLCAHISCYVHTPPAVCTHLLQYVHTLCAHISCSVHRSPTMCTHLLLCAYTSCSVHIHYVHTSPLCAYTLCTHTSYYVHTPPAASGHVYSTLNAPQTLC